MKIPESQKVGFGSKKKCLSKTFLCSRKKTLLALSLCAAYLPQSNAYEFSPGLGMEGSFNASLGYSVMRRVEGIDTKDLHPNHDDGNRNFDKGIVSSVVKASYELSINRDTDSGSFGLFNRGMAFYDFKIRNASNDNESPNTLNGNPIFGGSLTDLNDFTDDTQDQVGTDLRVLDLFVYYTSSHKQYPMSVRLGQQVINWGENAFIQTGISNAINPADVSQANIPGTEVKEILLPVESLYGSVELTDSISLEAYYQTEWKPTIAPPVGTFLSTNDYIAENGGESIILPGGATYRRGKDINADDNGQWGIALRWFSEALGETDFGFYYLNYHSKLPSLSLAGSPFGPGGAQPAVGPGAYHITYFDDIKLYGISFNTVLWNTAFSGEVAYHEGTPLQTIQVNGAAIGQAASLGGDPLYLFTPEDLVVAQLTLNRSLNNDAFVGELADNVGLIVEFGAVHAPDFEDGEIFKSSGLRDQTAWGYKARVEFTYYDALGRKFPAISGTDLVATVIFNHDVEGSSAIVAGSFEDNAKSAGLGLRAEWQNTIEAEIRYNAFFGDSELADRDNVSLSFKYRF